MWNRERWIRILATLLVLALFVLVAWLSHLLGKSDLPRSEEKPGDSNGALLQERDSGGHG